MAQGIAAHRWMMTAANQPMVREAFVATPGQGEVVVAVAGCGVCHTDLGYFYDGVRTNHPLPLALGHEISGRVVAAGAGAERWLGRAVIIPAVLPCGECDTCKRGRPNICRKQKMPGNDIQGGFASHIVVPARGLCPVDEARLAKRGLSLADVSVVADAVTTPYQAVVRAGVTQGSVAIVVGVGGVGGYSAQIAKAFGATVIAIDVDPAKLAAIGQHGASLTLNAREHDIKSLKAKIGEFCKANGLPLTEWMIFECSGTAAGQTTAFGLLTYGATLCVVGFTMDRVGAAAFQSDGVRCARAGKLGMPARTLSGRARSRARRQDQSCRLRRTASARRHQAVFEQAHAHKLARRAVLVPQQ